MSNKELLSIIIPAYKQEKTIKKDLQAIDTTLSRGLPSEFTYEVICVVDGQLDETEKEAKKVKSSKLRIFSYKNNQGKGYAVRFGMQKARGDYISFLDAGMDISPDGIMMLMAHLKWYKADIIVGSKRHPASKVSYTMKRKIFSLGYQILVKLLFSLPISDTQSGIKIFRKDVIKKILPRLLVKTYAMDIEMLAVSYFLGYKRIYEAPIEVRFNQRNSAVRWRTVFCMAWDSLAVFYRLKILRYYDDKNRSNWLLNNI